MLDHGQVVDLRAIKLVPSCPRATISAATWAELAVDGAHDGADAALISLADRLEAEEQRLAFFEGDVVLLSLVEPVEVFGGAGDRQVTVGRA
jgi:hypothetical protein